MAPSAHRDEVGRLGLLGFEDQGGVPGVRGRPLRTADHPEVDRVGDVGDDDGQQ
jgi:hypothetical protein